MRSENFGVVLMASVWAAAFALIQTAGALADDDIDVSREPPVTQLDAGDAAPFAGVLMPPGRAAKLGTHLESCNLKLKLNEQLFNSELKLRVDSLEAVVAIEKEAATKQRSILEKQLEDAERREWWDHPALLVGVGILGGAAAIVGSVYLVGQLRPILVPAVAP